MRKTGTLAVVAVLAAAVLAAGSSPALAGPRARIDLSSQSGELTLGSDGSAVVTGYVTGSPLDGDYTAVLTADDGSLPEPGATESASATVTVVGPHGRTLVLTGTGTVEGKWTDEVYQATHVFIGRYTAESSVRRADGTDGWFSVGLGTEARGYVEAFDS
ncbi:MAG TPA: hypothetical protein VFR56_02005 [Actinomycetes bacterium]|nr:hypothetical protein [Actinomycetes bacterium]